MRMKVKIVWQHCFVVTGNYARINGIQMHVLDWLGLEWLRLSRATHCRQSAPTHYQ